MPRINQRSLTQILEKLSITRLSQYLLLFLLGWSIVQVLTYFQTVLTIFIFSAILAFLLNYPVRWLSNYLPRSVAVVTVFLSGMVVLIGLFLTLGSAILSQGQQLILQSPELVNSLLPLFDRLNRVLSDLNLQINVEELVSELRSQIFLGIDFGLSMIQGTISNFVDLILVVVVTFFMLLDGQPIWRFILTPVPSHFQEDLTASIRANFLGFFWGRLLLSIFFAVSCFIVFVLLKIPYALLLATIAGLFDLIPGIGATMGVTLIAFIALPQGLLISLQIIGICVLLQQVEENILMPRIMQGSINMNPVVLFFSLLVGARVAGLVGLFLSVPIAGVIISLFELHPLQNGKPAPPQLSDRGNR